MLFLLFLENSVSSILIKGGQTLICSFFTGSKATIIASKIFISHNKDTIMANINITSSAVSKADLSSSRSMDGQRAVAEMINVRQKMPLKNVKRYSIPFLNWPFNICPHPGIKVDAMPLKTGWSVPLKGSSLVLSTDRYAWIMFPYHKSIINAYKKKNIRIIFIGVRPMPFRKANTASQLIIIIENERPKRAIAMSR